jgi:photosystem II stability/assembly factor-like uncharacterized protein
MRKAVAVLVFACACGSGERSRPPGKDAGSPPAEPAGSASLRFIATPAGVVAGQPFDVSVAVEDAAGRPAAVADEIVLELLHPPGSSATLTGTGRATADQGIAVFRGIAIDAPTASAALRASTAALFATSELFEVAPGHGGTPTNPWQRVAFPGGPVVELTSVPGTAGSVFAATARGIFRTTDAARTWTRCALSGAPQDMADGIVASSGAELWASFPRSGLWVSRDACATWTQRNDGIVKKPYGYYDSYRLERQVGAVYASSWDETYQRNESAGQWVRLPNPRNPDPIVGFALAPSSAQVAYAYTFGGVLHLSTDGGTTWTNRSTPQPDGVGNFRSFTVTGAIAVHPSEPGVALVADGRIYRTGDAARTLTPVSGFYANRVFFDRADGNIAFATLRAILDGGGLLRSSDAGRTWTASTSGIPFPEIWTTSLAADEADPSVLYVGLMESLTSGAGVYRSSSRGLSWERATSGIDVAGVVAIASDPSASAVYAATSAGLIYRSGDGGKTWSEVGVQPDVRSMSVDPADPRTVVAATSRAVVRSDDGGATWRGSGRAAFVVWHHPAVRGLLLAAGDGVQRSTDGGLTWRATPTPNAFFRGFAADLVTGRLFTAALRNSKIAGGLFVSDDAGATWTTVDGPEGVLVSDGAPHPALYVVTQRGTIERSEDGGRTWVRILEEPPVGGLAVSTADRRTLYAVRPAFCPDAPSFSSACVRSRGQVLRSDDRGATWSATGDFSREVPGAIWISPVDAANVLVGTSDGGVFRSTTGGR